MSARYNWHTWIDVPTWLTSWLFDQVQACDETHAWICPLDATALRLGCLKFKRRKIEIAVCKCALVMTCQWSQKHLRWCSWIQVTKYSARERPARVSPVPNTSDRQPTDDDRDVYMKTYISCKKMCWNNSKNRFQLLNWIRIL